MVWIQYNRRIPVIKAFISGACGFIGSHLTEALVAEGHEVTALSAYWALDTYGWLDGLEGMEKVRGDIRDVEQMRRFIKGHDIVFHLAALGSIPYSYGAPRSVFETNTMGTLNILEACRSAGAKLVHTSTSEVYGTAKYTPQDEEHPLRAQSPYAASKIAADKMVESYRCSFNLPSGTVRPFNTYGPRQSERAIIPTIIRKALDSRFDVIALGDLRPTRDLTYVEDTVRGFIAASEHEGEFNLGAGKTISMSDLAERIRGLVGCNKQVVGGDARQMRPPDSEVMELCAAPGLPGWSAECGLTDGLQRTIDWWRTREFRPDVGMVA